MFNARLQTKYEGRKYYGFTHQKRYGSYGLWQLYCDVAVNNGKIVEIGKDLSSDAEKVVDATGKLVFRVRSMCILILQCRSAAQFQPTAIFRYKSGGLRRRYNYFDYPVQHKGETIMGLINSKKEILEYEACVDYAFHCCITDLNDGEILNEMKTAVDEGITSFKCFLVYKKEGMMVDDANW